MLFGRPVRRWLSLYPDHWVVEHATDDDGGQTTLDGRQVVGWWWRSVGGQLPFEMNEWKKLMYLMRCSSMAVPLG